MPRCVQPAHKPTSRLQGTLRQFSSKNASSHWYIDWWCDSNLSSDLWAISLSEMTIKSPSWRCIMIQSMISICVWIWWIPSPFFTFQQITSFSLVLLSYLYKSISDPHTPILCDLAYYHLQLYPAQDSIDKVLCRTPTFRCQRPNSCVNFTLTLG